MSRASLPPLFGKPRTRIHCVGVAGMGLGPLAAYLSSRGWQVSGEDDAMNPEMRSALSRAGVTLGALPEDCDLVVRSSAVPMQHPTVAAALARAVPVVRRGELLAEAVVDRRLVAVCGSHGKTTTTAMLVHALRAAGFPAGYVCGGLFADGSEVAHAGLNEWVVAEIDESDGTIARFSPEITVIVNLDWDHPDQYPSVETLEVAFRELCARTRRSVLTSDRCSRSARVAPGSATFGFTGDYQVSPATQTAEAMVLSLRGRFTEGSEQVRATGDFNAYNAAAALAALAEMGVPRKMGALGSFPGVLRRQSTLMDDGGIRVLEDYAHHPSEIRALLESLRRGLPARSRLVVVFQPHRFSRTAALKAQFAEALCLADRVYLMDVYPAGEAPLPGGSTADLQSELAKTRAAASTVYLPGNEAGLLSAVDADAGTGDLVAFVGAGDIAASARAFVSLRRRKVKAPADWDGLAHRLRALVSAESRVLREEPLAAKTTMRVGGNARVYVEPSNVEDLAQVVRECSASTISVHFLGRGSNLVIPDEGVDGVVVCLSHASWSIFERLADGRVRVGAGLRLKNLCGLAASAGLSGFEFLEGIPGSVGGALRMNAGAMGGWMFDVVDEATLMRRDGSVATLAKQAMQVDYRVCRDLTDAIALFAVLRPRAQSASAEVSRQIDVYREKRHESQPREPSAGCIFKNPPGNSAGRLIDEAGLKGTRVGGAEVSKIHANFVVNMGGATSSDVIELIRRVRASVRERKAIDLEPEVILYGKEWKDVL